MPININAVNKTPLGISAVKSLIRAAEFHVPNQGGLGIPKLKEATNTLLDELIKEAGFKKEAFANPLNLLKRIKGAPLSAAAEAATKVAPTVENAAIKVAPTALAGAGLVVGASNAVSSGESPVPAILGAAVAVPAFRLGGRWLGNAARKVMAPGKATKFLTQMNPSGITSSVEHYGKQLGEVKEMNTLKNLGVRSPEQQAQFENLTKSYHEKDFVHEHETGGTLKKLKGRALSVAGEFSPSIKANIEAGRFNSQSGGYTAFAQRQHDSLKDVAANMEHLTSQGHKIGDVTSRIFAKGHDPKLIYNLPHEDFKQVLSKYSSMTGLDNPALAEAFEMMVKDAGVRKLFAEGIDKVTKAVKDIKETGGKVSNAFKAGRDAARKENLGTKAFDETFNEGIRVRNINDQGIETPFRKKSSLTGLDNSELAELFDMMIKDAGIRRRVAQGAEGVLQSIRETVTGAAEKARGITENFNRPFKNVREGVEKPITNITAELNKTNKVLNNEGTARQYTNTTPWDKYKSGSLGKEAMINPLKLMQATPKITEGISLAKTAPTGITNIAKPVTSSIKTIGKDMEGYEEATPAAKALYSHDTSAKLFHNVKRGRGTSEAQWAGAEASRLQPGVRGTSIADLNKYGY